ncbi:hypothetical protein ACEU0D_002674 [Enterobacter ludwigii]|uniref:hypothetical protein n=1 Tax=Enterobacter ludwigii TaxID=299767 RepID=UPI003731559A
MDESRKQFEAEMAKLGDCVDMRRAKNGDEEYMAWDVALAWRFWNLSRAVIEIYAPAEPFYPMPKDNSPTDHYHYGRQSIISKVRAAGIKVKE